MALYLDIRVVPQSGKSLCVIDKNGQIKCFVKSPPEGGKANAELGKMLSKALRIPRSDIEIVMGATSRKKRIKIAQDIERQDVLLALGLEKQLTL